MAPPFSLDCLETKGGRKEKKERKFHLDGFALVPFLGSELLEGRRGDEDDKGHEVRLFEYLERLRMEVEDAKFAGEDDGPDRIQRRPIVRLLVLSVLHKAPVHYVRLKLGPRDEMVVLPVHLGILFRPACVCH